MVPPLVDLGLFSRRQGVTYAWGIDRGCIANGPPAGNGSSSFHADARVDHGET
ncbi:hypothetical protein GCM10007874_21770 [Labrys miyagiensis]|uniref:Uncharacterized protein n=1 Tax=Labrys miyagiensis TaxID=346912 RepID=A0ABQ6CG82_9HYPH|nr:hypothetical protein GCM10007874_21770 [Labrys miyagiensis]